MKLILGFTILCLIIPQTANSNESEFSALVPLEWLVGKWISDDGKHITTETWRKVSLKTLEGTGVTREKASGEIINKETLRLVLMSGDIFYIAKVVHNQLPIAFKLTKHSDSEFVFENKLHDFPKRIEYKQISDEQMMVVVGDTLKKFTLNFNRSIK